MVPAPGSGPQRVQRVGFLEGPRCADCQHPADSYPNDPPSRGRQQSKCSLRGASQDSSMGPGTHWPKITVWFFFPFSLTFFFIIFSFFLKIKNKNKTKQKEPPNLCGPSNVTPIIPKGVKGPTV